MQRNISKFSNQTFDLLIVGGGINGAGLANVASLNGLRTALIEKGDFASGTSGKSTKLLHGGLRYLEHFEFGLVAESLRERFIQAKSAPHLVKVLPFILPVYRRDPRPLWKMRLGVWLYDALSGKYSFGHRSRLSARDLAAKVPGLKTDGLLGGVSYYDVQMDDARLCLENILMADSRGAVAANYVEMESFLMQGRRCIGVRAVDRVGGESFEIKAKYVVCAAGVWTKNILSKESQPMNLSVRATKGVHLVYRRQLSDQALFLQSGADGRMFFIIPWRGFSLIGTTDTDYSGDPDEVKVEEADIRYLIEQSRLFFPKEMFFREDMIETFAGLRPLVKASGAPSSVSRRHVVRTSPAGVVYVTGGKYTTYRIIAEDVLKRLLSGRLRDTSVNFPLYGGGYLQENPQDLARRYGLPEATVRHLISVYGTRCTDVLQHVRRDPCLKEPLGPCGAIRAQEVYAYETEMAVRPEDVFRRRLGVAFPQAST